MKCFACAKSLTGGLDTYGDVGEELCWDCYAARNAEANTDFWYGLGPHKHAYDEKGNIIIGGTTFEEITVPFVDGAYDFGDRTFTPDPEAGGCGVWRMKQLAGWK